MSRNIRRLQTARKTLRALAALMLGWVSLSSFALVAVEVAGIKSKDGGNTFYLKAGTPSTVMATTLQIPSRSVDVGVVESWRNRPRGAMILGFAANESGMVNDWQNFRVIANGNASYLQMGVREGNQIFANGDVSYWGDSAWKLATAAGQTYTVSAWSEQNWRTAPAVCHSYPLVGWQVGPCTLPDGRTGYISANDPLAEPYPSPASGTPAPVTFTLREYVPMRITGTLSETQGLSANITLANEDEGQMGAVFAALMIDGKFFFIHSDRSTVTWYQGESTLPPVFTGTLRSGSFNLWPTLTQADRLVLKQLGAVLLVGYGTGAHANEATLEMLKVDTRLPTTTPQIDKMRYMIALPASGW